jgi:hypothetical protein
MRLRQPARRTRRTPKALWPRRATTDNQRQPNGRPGIANPRPQDDALPDSPALDRERSTPQNAASPNRRHCWLWPAVCPALLPGSCIRGAAPGVSARGWSGGDGQERCRRRVCVRIWRPGCGFRAVCVAAQALWVPVSPPTSRSGCTPRRSAGRAPGGWKDSPHDNRSGGTQTVPAAALFVLIGASPHTR